MQNSSTLTKIDIVDYADRGDSLTEMFETIKNMGSTQLRTLKIGSVLESSLRDDELAAFEAMLTQLDSLTELGVMFELNKEETNQLLTTLTEMPSCKTLKKIMLFDTLSFREYNDEISETEKLC